MSKEKPVVYIFYGDDQYSIERAISDMSAGLGDSTMVDLNMVRLDAKAVGMDGIYNAASTMPFLADRRLVVVSHPLTHFTTEDSKKRFLTFLEKMPATTALVLIVEDQWKNKKNNHGQWEVFWETMRPNHWLMKWAAEKKERVLIKSFQQPGKGAMNGWIQREAKDRGGEFSGPAAQTLALYVGNDTRLASLEIEKLLTYVNFERPVEIKDVELLTTSIEQSNVFGLVDAMAMGDLRTAMNQLQIFLESEDVFMLFGMVVRQFRQLIQTREILDEGGDSSQVQSYLGGPKFVAEKMEKQARRFTLQKLLTIYHRLLILDEQLKTSQVEPALGMSMFIAELGQ